MSIDKETGFIPALHASSHIDGSDDIQSATTAQKGLMTAAMVSELTAAGLITGYLTGFAVTINGGDNTKADVSSGTAVTVNWIAPSSPTYTFWTFAGATALTITDLTSELFTAFYLDESGALKQKGGATLTRSEKRKWVALDAVTHPNLANLQGISRNAVLAYQGINAILDYIFQIGPINTGNRMSAGGTNLAVQKSAGTTSLPFINHNNDAQNPAVLTNGTQNPLSPWVSSYRDGAGGFTIDAGLTATDPTLYDDGSGTLVALTNNNKWSVKRYYFFGQNQSTAETYGQAEYDSKAEAVAAIFTENPIIDSLLLSGTFVSALVIKKNNTNLSITAEAEFFDIVLQSSSSAGGAGSQDRQSVYDISTNGIITTDSTRGAIGVKRGSAADADNIFEGRNAADAIVFAITGEGDVLANNISHILFSDYIIGSTSGPTTTVTTSGTAVVIAEMTKTFTPDSTTNKIKVEVSCSFNNTGDQTAIMGIFIDGVLEAETETREYANAGVFPGSIYTFWQGTHATSPIIITARMWTTGGTLTATGVLRKMLVTETRE